MKKIRNTLISLVGCGLLVVAAGIPLANAQTGKITKRFSIAVSGGASMGAYEAGLNWGALYLLRHFSLDDPVLGGESRPLELASVAGASAGGINSILSGLVWCSREEQQGGLTNRVDDNLFRDVWLSIDINALLPDKPDSPLYLPGDGLLSRRTLADAADYLKKKWNSPAFRPGCRLPLGVSVTRVVPAQLKVNNVAVQNQRFTIPFELRVGPDKTVNYYFNPARYYAQRDLSMLVMPYRKGGQKYRLADRTIEDVALASAAFPIAFGRLRLQYCSLSVETSSPPEKKTGTGITPADSALLCPDGYNLVEAEFADGGLFDNIPLGLARKLAENNVFANDNPLPVSYVYLDPDPVRYRVAKPAHKDRCQSETPPAACREMKFGLISQGSLLVDAFGTARKYELFREIVSDRWRLDMAVISEDLVNKLKAGNNRFDCMAELPWFDPKLTCADALTRSARLLQTAYIHSRIPLARPVSVRKLRAGGLVKHCKKAIATDNGLETHTCEIDILKFRYTLGRAVQNIYRRSGLELPDLERRIRSSLTSIYHDRQVYVSSRGGAITGTLLGGFGAFMDRKFREYDYYVGVYDAVVLTSMLKCTRFFPPESQPEEYRRCFGARSERAYHTLGVDQDPRARYVFSLLARDEFSDHGELAFAYSRNIPVDRDMQIIHAGLRKSQQETGPEEAREQGLFAVEEGFFDYLRENGFLPTATAEKGDAMLAMIMEDPEQWSYEFIRRSTSRLVYLEQQADKIEAAREPDPDNRAPSLTRTVAAAAYVLQTGTYKYPTFDFAPSTTPTNWGWRYLIPYEFAFDMGEGDFLLTWQPTWTLSNHNTVALRGSLGLDGGLLGRETDINGNKVERSNYVALGLDYTYLTGDTGVSGWGITPTYFHLFEKPQLEKQSTFGGDVHVGFLKNRLRLGLGFRDYEDISDTWYLQLGVADVPGLVYWLFR